MANLTSSPVACVDSPSTTDREPREKTVSVPVERLASLDAFRGFLMLCITGGGWLVGGMEALWHNRVVEALSDEMGHTDWQGLRFWDCIWPSFMLMVGVSVPFSLQKRSLTQTYPQQLAQAAKRAGVLFLLGSLRESVEMGSPHLVEFSSALQPIAIAYFVAVLVVRKSWRFQAILVGAILAIYGLVLAFIPAPGIPAGSYQLNQNLVNWVDIALFGQDWYRWRFAVDGWGTVLSTIPTISTTLLGLLIGELLMSPRSKETKAKLIGTIGLGCIAAGYLISPLVPIVMKMWTTSYGLASAGFACLMFVFFYWLIDIRGYRKWAFPLTVVGMNAIFIYVFSSIFHLRPLVGVFTDPIARAVPNSERLLQSAGVLAVEWIILFWMYKRKIFIKA